MKAALVTYASTLVHLQLGQAIDSCILAQRYSARRARGIRPRERRFAIGSILHSYAALEGVANKFRFEVLENPEGRHFAALRDARKILDGWQRRHLEDKLVWLGEQRGRSFPTAWRPAVAEARRYRNLLAHGFTMKSLVLFEETKGSYQVGEQDHYYPHRFPITGFSRPDRITAEDALKVLKAFLPPIGWLNFVFGESDNAYVYEWRGQPLFAIGRDVGAVEVILKRLEAARPLAFRAQRLDQLLGDEVRAVGVRGSSQRPTR